VSASKKSDRLPHCLAAIAAKLKIKIGAVKVRKPKFLGISKKQALITDEKAALEAYFLPKSRYSLLNVRLLPTLSSTNKGD